MMKQQTDDIEKIRKVALQSKVNVISGVEFRGSMGDTSGILSNLNEL